MNDENVTVGQAPDQEPESAKTVASMSDTDAEGMLFTKEGALSTCRDGQNHLLMFSICATFRAE